MWTYAMLTVVASYVLFKCIYFYYCKRKTRSLAETDASLLTKLNSSDAP